MRKQLEDPTCRCIVLHNISNVGCGRHVTFSDSINNGLDRCFIQSSGSHFFLEHQLGGLHLVLRLPQDGNRLTMGK